MKRKLQIFGGAVIVVGAGMVFELRKSPNLSPAIQKQVSYEIFYPDKASGYRVATDHIRYDSKTNVLNIPAKNNDTTITLNEQATPQQFSDIPQYFPALIEKLNNYSSFESANGHVDLTRPKELNGEQQAVLNSKGTLLFAHPSQDLSDDQWRKFFNNLDLLK